MGAILTIEPWRAAAATPTAGEYRTGLVAWRNVLESRDRDPATVMAHELARFRESILGAFEAFADDGAEVFADQAGEDALRALIARFRPDRGTP